MKKRRFAMALAIAMTLSSLEMPAALVQAEEIRFTTETEEAGTEEVFGDGQTVFEEEVQTDTAEAGNAVTYTPKGEHVDIGEMDSPYLDEYGRAGHFLLNNGRLDCSTILRYVSFGVSLEGRDENGNVVMHDYTWGDFGNNTPEVVLEYNNLALHFTACLEERLPDDSGYQTEIVRHEWADTLTEEGSYWIRVVCQEYPDVEIVSNEPIRVWNEWPFGNITYGIVENFHLNNFPYNENLKGYEVTLDENIGIKGSELISNTWWRGRMISYGDGTESDEISHLFEDGDEVKVSYDTTETEPFLPMAERHLKAFIKDEAGNIYGWNDTLTKTGRYVVNAKCIETNQFFYSLDYFVLTSSTPHTHTWSDWTVTTPATCTTAGTETRTCDCGETETRELPATGHTWGDWTVTTPAACTIAGTETRTCDCGETETRELPATGHTWGQWTTAEAATVFAPEKQQRICASCGFAETRDNGTALTPTVKANVNTKYALPMKTRQVLTTLRVSGLANGDSIASWKSSNTKIVTVKGKADGTCKITARRAGKAAITVTLASGKEVSIKISVKNAAVKTSSITGVPSKMTLKKGQRASLTPSILPITSREKVTYSSSNKKVVAIDSKGRMKAVNPGTAKVTVKSGSKRKTCTVKVTGIPAAKITGIPSKLTLRRYKTKTLKPVIAPKNTTDKVTYKSSNSKVVTISSKGVLKAKKKGTATITVKAGKISIRCKVTVK